MPESMAAPVDMVTTIRLLEGIGYGADNIALGLNGQVWSVQAPLVEFGSDDQKKRYLPGLCSGDLIASHGMTEPDSGSDAFSLRSRAEKVDGGYVLNGHKCYIGLSAIADLALVFASTNPDDGEWGISASWRAASRATAPPPPTNGPGQQPSRRNRAERLLRAGANRLGPEGIGVGVFTSGWERAFIFASHVGSAARQLDDIAYVKEGVSSASPSASSSPSPTASPT